MGNVCCGSREESPKEGAFTASGGQGGDSNEIDKWDAKSSSGGGDSSGALGVGGSGTTPSMAGVANSNDPMSMMDQQQQQQHQMMMDNKENAATATSASNSNSNAAAANLLLLRQEQTRLEMIVQAAGRGMVAVRSTRGSNAYYDQGFAAALGQHLEQTTTFPKHLPRQLPPFAANNNSSSGSTTTTATSSSGTGNANINSNSSAAASSLSSSDAANKTASSSSVYARLNQPAWECIQLGTKKHGLAGCAGENPHAYFDHVAESFLDEIVPHKKRLFANVQPIVESLL